MSIIERTQQIGQQSKGALDGIAVASGFAVWGEWLPIWVGVFTVIWLGMQMVIHAPRLLDSLKELKKRFFKKD